MRFAHMLLALLVAVPALARPEVSSRVTTTTIFILAPGYTVVLDGDTGSISRISAQENGESLGQSAYMQAPWVIRLGDSEWLSPGALKGRGGKVTRTNVRTPDGLEYTWVWTLDDAATALTATLTMHFRDHQFDGRLVIDLRRGADLKLGSYPANFLLPGSQIQRMVYPHRSGIVLLPPFFDSSQTIGTRTPAGFTPFLWWETSAGTLALSNVIEGANRAAATHELNITRDAVGSLTLPVLHYDQVTSVAAGGRFDSGRILFQVSRDVVAAARAHWDAGESKDYPTLPEKLGQPLFEKLRRAPLLKYPEATRAADFTASVASLPSPAIIHIASYMQGGHDENYPDYLPPRASLGTTAELQAMAAAVRAAGSLFVPYTNPTWWDDQSPTVAALGTDIVARKADGSLVEETYGTKRGYVVTPWHPKVRERLAQGYAQFADLQLADLLFEDQVGARDLAFDGNPASPHSWSHSQGLLANTRIGRAHFPLMTEMAWDQLAETEAGFCGNLRLDWEQPALAAEMYRPFPLAVILANGNSAFYPHNLDGNRMVHSRAELLYNVALGYQMSYDLNRGTSDWLQVAAEVQSRLLSRTVGQRVTAFADDRDTSQTTRMSYANGASVLANWSTRAALAEGDGELGPEGFWLRATAPRVEGGWVSKYGGDAVDKLLIIEQKDAAVEVVSVADAGFSIDLAADWFPAGPGAYELRRTASDDSSTTAPLAVTAAGVRVQYQAGNRALRLGPAGGIGGWRVF